VLFFYIRYLLKVKKKSGISAVRHGTLALGTIRRGYHISTSLWILFFGTPHLVSSGGYFFGAWFTAALRWVMKTAQHFNSSACCVWVEFVPNAHHVFFQPRDENNSGNYRDRHFGSGIVDPFIPPQYLCPMQISAFRLNL